MRWTLFLVFCVLHVYSFPKKKTSQVYMATIDLDTNRKLNVDPEVVLDIGSQLPPVKRRVTPAPSKLQDYGEYEDYELTAKPEEIPSTTLPPRKKNEKEHPLLDSQFKPHVKITMNNQKSSGELRDEVARLMGDLHREELTLRTTVTKEDMKSTTSSPVEMMLLGNETMFFSDEEGSGMEEDQLLNATMPTVSTSRRPLLFTTLIQEIKSVPVTARPDPFAHLDYDLSDHSNIKKQKATNLTRIVEKKRKVKLHGGAVGTAQSITRPTKFRNPKPLLIRPGKNLNRKKNLRKIKKIERMRRVKNLNHRVRAQNRMRLRKVLSKMLFGPRDSDVTSSRSFKPKLVGSNGIVTPNPFKNRNQKKFKPKIDFQKRDKREVEESGTGGGGAWDNEKIELEPHPYYHLEEAPQRTQVQPSLLINEDPEDDSEDVELQNQLPVKSGLVHVTLGTPKRLKMVTLSSVKKVSKKEKNANGVALVVPTARRPTMLELLIGDFLQRLPPVARNPYIDEEQWS